MNDEDFCYRKFKCQMINTYIAFFLIYTHNQLLRYTPALALGRANAGNATVPDNGTNIVPVIPKKTVNFKFCICLIFLLQFDLLCKIYVE
jgi:hypothetical protein